MNKISFRLNGLTCGACVKLVSSRFKRIPGVQEVTIDLDTGNTDVLTEAALNLKGIEDSLQGLPYTIN